jgi:hypothetical protein
MWSMSYVDKVTAGYCLFTINPGFVFDRSHSGHPDIQLEYMINRSLKFDKRGAEWKRRNLVS